MEREHEGWGWIADCFFFFWTDSKQKRANTHTHIDTLCKIEQTQNCQKLSEIARYLFHEWIISVVGFGVAVVSIYITIATVDYTVRLFNFAIWKDWLLLYQLEATKKKRIEAKFQSWLLFLLYWFLFLPKGISLEHLIGC